MTVFDVCQVKTDQHGGRGEAQGQAEGPGELKSQMHPTETGRRRDSDLESGEFNDAAALFHRRSDTGTYTDPGETHSEKMGTETSRQNDASSKSTNKTKH